MTDEKRPVHLANKDSWAGNECRTAWDNKKYGGPDPMTRLLEEVTCKPCKDWMVKDGRCPGCGDRKLEWVADNRECTAVFYLRCRGCFCDDLPGNISLDHVAAALTVLGWRP